MDSPLLKSQYVVKIGEMSARLECTQNEKTRIISLLEKLDITNSSGLKISITNEGGKILYDNNKDGPQ